MRRLGGVLASVTLLCSATETLAANNHELRAGAARIVATSAAVVEDARAPIGWSDFCRDHAEECDTPTLAPVDLRLTTANWAALQRVNRKVNAAIVQMEDIELYGVTEKWAYPDAGMGDCEDIVLEKRRTLMKMGFPRQTLLMTVVRDREGAGHAVLTVKTDRGDFILDNKTSRILSWESTGYGFVKRQSQEHPDHWVTIGPPAPSGLTVAGH